MAMKINILGKTAVVKQTRPWGTVYATAPPWTGGVNIPAPIRARNEKFTAAARACAGESKKFGNSPVSEYNKCISKHLRG